MSVVITRSLFCDCEHPSGPCGEWCGEADWTATHLRRDAREHGWTIRRIGGRTADQCPECSRTH